MSYPCGEIVQTEQCSEEWLLARCGSIGASSITKVMSKGKGGAGSLTAKKYLMQIVRERITGIPTKGYCNASMQRGLDLEEAAISCYEFKFDVITEKIGLVKHPTIPNSHASPDRLLGENGLIQVKCPEPETHGEYLLANRVPPEYEKQMQWEMCCTGREYNLFVSYAPEWGEDLQLFICRLYRDDAKIAEIENQVIAFNQSVDDLINELKGLR